MSWRDDDERDGPAWEGAWIGSASAIVVVVVVVSVGKRPPGTQIKSVGAPRFAIP